KKPVNVRRGEGGREWTGGPLWSPVVPSSFLFTDAPFVTLSLDQTRSITPHPRVTCPPDRVTIKALPASLHPPSPLRIIRFHFGRLMRIIADLSALGGCSAILMKKLKNIIGPLQFILFLVHKGCHRRQAA